MRSPTPPIVSSAPQKCSSDCSTWLCRLPRANVALFLGLAISGLALDLLTKAWVFRLLGPPGARDTWWLWDGYVGLQTAYNAGGLFGMFQGAVHWLAGFSVVAALAVLYWFFLKG